MDKKIMVKIDLLKINKNKIEERTYKNESGFEVKQKLYSMEIVPTMPKIVKELEKSNLVKKYFVAEGQTKEERLAKTKSTILGDGLVFEDKIAEVEQVNDGIDYPQDELGDIPF